MTKDRKAPNKSSLLRDKEAPPMDAAYRRRSEELLQLTLEDERRLNDREAPFDLDQTVIPSVTPTDTASSTPIDPEEDRAYFRALCRDADRRHGAYLFDEYLEDLERGLDVPSRF